MKHAASIRITTLFIAALFIVVWPVSANQLLKEITSIAEVPNQHTSLNKLRNTAELESNITAFTAATESILKGYLKQGEYDAFSKEIRYVKQHNLWSSTPELQIIVYIALADEAYRKGDVQLASDIQTTAITLAQNHNFISRMSEVYTRQGIFYRNLGLLDKALEYYERALPYAEQSGDPLQASRITMNKGVIYEGQNKYNEALELYKQALPSIENGNNPILLADILFNITAVYMQLHELDLALTFAQRVLKLDEASGDINNIIYSLNRISSIYLLLGDNGQAQTYLNRSIELAEKGKNKQQLAVAFMRKARILMKQGKLDQALEIANKSADNALTIDNPITKNNVIPPLAELYISINQNQKAIELIEMLPGDTISPTYMVRKQKILAKANYNIENYQQAYSHLKILHNTEQARAEEKLKAYRDEMNSELAKFSEQLKVKDLELENEKQQSDLEVMQYRQYFGITLALIVFLLFSLLIYSQIKKKQMAQAQARLKEAAIDHKNQMLSDICHELRTPFSVLKLQIEAPQYNLEPDTELAHNRLNAKIEQLSHLVSDIDQLSQADSMVLTLNKVKINAHNLLNAIITDNRVLIEKVGLELKLDIQLDETLDVDLDINRIQQVFHNLFSNAIRYTSVPGFIRLKARNDQNNLFIQVDDTAPGVSLEDIEHLFNRLYRVEKSRSRATGGLGLGLSICKSLIELHNGRIIAKQGKSGGLCIQITLPLH